MGCGSSNQGGMVMASDSGRVEKKYIVKDQPQSPPEPQNDTTKQSQQPQSLRTNEGTPDPLECLRLSPLAIELSEEDLKKFSSYLSYVEPHQHALIYVESREAADMFFVAQGEIDMHLKGHSMYKPVDPQQLAGDLVIAYKNWDTKTSRGLIESGLAAKPSPLTYLTTKKKGEFFGIEILAAIGPNPPAELIRTCSAIAASAKTAIWHIPLDKLKEFLQANVALVQPFINALGGQIAERLRKITFLEKLSARQISTLSNLVEYVHVKKGEKVFDAGDLSPGGNSMYFIIDGQIDITFNLGKRSDKKHKSVSINKGSIIGEIGIMIDIARTAGAVASEDSHLAEMKKCHFSKFVAIVPGILQAFKKNIYRYQVTLGHILSSGFVLEYYRKHCVQEMSPENLAFWTACRDYREEALFAIEQDKKYNQSRRERAEQSMIAAQQTREERKSNELAFVQLLKQRVQGSSGKAKDQSPDADRSGSFSPGLQQSIFGVGRQSSYRRDPSSLNSIQSKNGLVDEQHLDNLVKMLQLDSILRCLARSIFEVFLSDDDSHMRVNMPHFIVDDIKNALDDESKHLDEYLFEDAELEVLHLMEDSYDRFLRRPEFDECLAAINSPHSDMMRKMHLI